MRTATLVGGLATGALLLTGTAAQADDTQATPEMLGGLPQVPTSALPGLDAIPGLNTVLPAQDTAETRTDAKDGDRADKDKNRPSETPGSGPIGDLLGNLGGGLPVPLPF